MGLAIFSIAFYSAYLLFLVGLLISALFARDPKKQKKRLITLSILILPVLHFIAGKSAYEFYFKRQAGFHYQDNYSALYFNKTRSFFFDCEHKCGNPLNFFHELKLGSSDFLEFSGRSRYLDGLQSKYYRVSNLSNDDCYWKIKTNRTDDYKHRDPLNIKKCFQFKPIDSPKSDFGFKTEVNYSIYFLPIIRERTILFETNLQKEVGRLDTYQFYYFYGSVFGGSQYPYLGGDRGPGFFYKKLQRPWDYYL